MSLSLGFQFLGLALVAIIAIHHRWLAVRIHVRPRPEPLRWPRLAVLRPIRGLDPGARQNLDALLDSDYPGPIEFLFLLDDADDASFPLVEAAIARHPQLHARIVLTGTPPPHRTGKIHKMIHGAELVDADVLAFSDSDTRPQPNMLRELVALLESDPRHGIAFAPTVAVAEDVHMGDIGYELLVNAWYGAAVDRVAGERGEVPFAMGQLMLIRATALAAIGTMRAAEGELVDDMFLGRKMIEHGYANVTCSTRVPVVIGGMALGEFLRVFRKWIFFSQSQTADRIQDCGLDARAPRLRRVGHDDRRHRDRQRVGDRRQACYACRRRVRRIAGAAVEHRSVASPIFAAVLLARRVMPFLARRRQRCSTEAQPRGRLARPALSPRSRGSASRRMIRTKILGIGGYVPDRVIDNDELACLNARATSARRRGRSRPTTRGSASAPASRHAATCRTTAASRPATSRLQPRGARSPMRGSKTRTRSTASSWARSRPTCTFPARP